MNYLIIQYLYLNNDYFAFSWLMVLTLMEDDLFYIIFIIFKVFVVL